MRKVNFAAAFAIACSFAGAANAAYTIEINQIGSAVVLTGSGSINLTNITSLPNSNIVAGFLNPGGSVAVVGTGGLVSVYAGINDPVDFGSVSSINVATSASGLAVGLAAGFNQFYVP